MSGPDEARPFASSFVVRWLAAVLCLEIAAMHVIYQGGFALRHPGYVGVAHVILEVAECVLSNSVGLPGYVGDIDNLSEPSAIVGLIAAGMLLLTALAALLVVGPSSPDSLSRQAPPGRDTASPSQIDTSV